MRSQLCADWAAQNGADDAESPQDRAGAAVTGILVPTLGTSHVGVTNALARCVAGYYDATTK
jgi:hypothetical protein